MWILFRAYSLGESVSSIVGLSLSLMDASFLTFGATLGQQLGYLIPATAWDSSGKSWTYTLGNQVGYLAQQLHEILLATAGSIFLAISWDIWCQKLHEILQTTAGPTLGNQLGYLMPETAWDSSDNSWTYSRQSVGLFAASNCMRFFRQQLDLL